LAKEREYLVTPCDLVRYEANHVRIQFNLVKIYRGEG